MTRGTSEFNLTLPDGTKIRCRWGTHDEHEKRAFRNLVRTYQQNATGLALLARLGARGAQRIAPMQLLAAHRTETTGQLAAGPDEQLLLTTGEGQNARIGLFDRYIASRATKASEKQARDDCKLVRRFVSATDRLCDLPRILGTVREAYVKAGESALRAAKQANEADPRAGAYTFNHIRSDMLGVIRIAYSSDGSARPPLWWRVRQEVPRMKVRKHREKNRGLLPAEFQAVLEAIKYVPADLRPAMLETIMVMAGHGFGPKEYWEDGYEVHPDDGYVRIFGTKVPDSGVRVRNVPLLWPIPDAPSICRAAFEDLLQVVAQHAKLPRGVGLRPYTLRHTYGVWLNKAKGADKDTIDGGTQDYYMGHESPSMRALYGHIAPPVDQYARDGAILRHHLAGVLKAAHGQRVVADAKVA